MNVRFQGISRRYPGVTALDGVSFDVAGGECHAICGENGAGKSTLGKILAGVERPDAGEIAIDGARVSFASPADARRAGIAMVHQELALCPNLSVEENLCLAALPSVRGFVNRAALTARATSMLRDVGADFKPQRLVAELSIADRQLVQIAAAVGADARVVIFDEPTSSLGERDAERLYATIASLKARGVAVVYISHRMNEIFTLADRITVLRDGRHVETRAAAEFDEASLVAAMIGRRLDAYFPAHAERAPGDERLQVHDLRTDSGVNGVTFSLRRGEVLGLAGLVGAGRTEVARALFGLDRMTAGTVIVDGARARIRSPRDAMRLGIGLVPEDRKHEGVVLGMRNRENASMATLGRYARAGVVSRAAESVAASTAFDRATFRGDPEVLTGTLSGGNQQKVVFAKWVMAASDILILDEPTRGVDVGAKAELHAWIDQFTARGGSVLLISSELPELLNLSTRILVLREGRVVTELARAEATQERLLRGMSGLTS